MNASRVHHRLIIRHPTDPAILLSSDAGGTRLPALVTDDRHTAEVGYINAAVRERFGLVTTVLRSLVHSHPHREPVFRVHELEVHGGSPVSAELHWCDRERLGWVRCGDDATVIADWAAEQGQPASISDGREWERPGWFAGARGWIDAALRDAGLPVAREVVQLRAWPSSCVLLVRTAGGDLYFKAMPQSLSREGVVTAYLARHAPGSVAPLVAFDAERRWLLVRACRGRKLEDVSDSAWWERAAATYGRLQVACITRVGELRRLGCGERSLESLARAIEPLSLDTAALRPGEEGGLSAVEYAQLRAHVQALRSRCGELDACGIPLSIEHGDLWPGNFFMDDRSCAIIDWEDVAIGHPFLSLAPLIVGLELYQPLLCTEAVKRRIERAYLRPFISIAPAQDLGRVLRTSLPLAFIDMAVRYQRQRASVVRLHPWMLDLVPQLVRLALAQLES
jgi:hypothetical protein